MAVSMQLKSVNSAVDKCLLSIREIFHKSSRYSSRNEALEEIAKLFFAHIMSILNGGKGIAKDIVCTNDNAALSLADFVKKQFAEYGSKGESYDISFELNIKRSENEFALEIIDVFEKSFEDIDLREKIKGTDILNDIFGKFLADSFVDEKQLGQYLTPQEIINFSIEMLFTDMDIERIERDNLGYVLDPSCGVGSFLTGFIDKIYELRQNNSGLNIDPEKIISNNIVGIDKSERMIKLALINLAMFGYQNNHIFLKNALDFTNFDLRDRVSVIMTNPPFGAEFPYDEIQHFKIVNLWSDKAPKKVNSEVLFLEKYVDWLAPGGALLCIVPDSILNNKGVYENLRQGIAPEITIKAVISLPSNTFATTGTETKTSLLYLVKEKYNPNAKTYMAICNNNGYDVVTVGTHKTKKYNDSNELFNILKDYQTGGSVYGKWLTGINDCVRWDATYHAAISEQMDKKIKEMQLVSLREVACLSNERFNPKRYESGKEFDYIEISDVDVNQMRAYGKKILCGEAPGRARKIVHCNDIIFSTVRPERGIVAVVTEQQDGSVCTTGFAVIKALKIEPMVLAYLLQSDFVTLQIKKYSMGISYPVIDEKDLLDIKLPITINEIDIYDQEAEVLKEKEKEVIKLRKSFKDSIERKMIIT